MMLAPPAPKTFHAVSRTVLTCYELLDASTAHGMTDFTEGKYLGDKNDRASYLEAQRRQAEYLLDQVRCAAGSRLLDIGCGNGRILKQAGQRGAEPVGITISPRQVDRCRRLGLTAYGLNYRDIGPEWDGQFDGIVANGSLEHFVQVDDAIQGQADRLYEELFAISRRLLSPGCRMVTTAIHFKDAGQVRPDDVRKGPYAHKKRTAEYHFSMVLERTFGGWYPAPGQLERCARARFRLVREEDGTHDYHLTSEYWLRRIRWLSASNPLVWLSLAGKLARWPRPTIEMLRCLAWDQSWNWQFREPAPTRLLRQTWEAI
jgi:cyclopropane fatty-acyl-phospholipid synthase-like methyltransferase